LAGAEHLQDRSAFETGQGPEFSSLAVYSGRQLIGFIAVLSGMTVAWAADDSPLGTYGTRKEALAAINADART
jgi:hypothetical protein